jgi:predicted HicB family RNase H-like nuclease
MKLRLANSFLHTVIRLSNSWGNMGLKMKKPDRFDGYTVNMFLDEDGEYLAHFVELPNVSAFGESPEEALSELAIEAAKAGISLNAINAIVSQKLAKNAPV